MEIALRWNCASILRHSCPKIKQGAMHFRSPPSEAEGQVRRTLKGIR